MKLESIGTCETGDDISSCSAVESTVQVSHWDQLDPDEVRYLLLYFAPYLIGGMIYNGRYWGVEAASAAINFAFYGVPVEDMSEETKELFESTLKQFFNEKAATVDVDQLKILSVEVQNVAPILPDRVLYNDENELNESGATDVTTTVSGEYFPPPRIILKEVLLNMFGDDFSKIVDELKKSGNPYFKDLKAITNGRSMSPTMSPTTLAKSKSDQIEEGGGSNVGMIIGIIVLVLVVITFGIVCICSLKNNDIDSSYEHHTFEVQKSLYHIEPNDDEVTILTDCESKFESPMQQYSNEDNSNFTSKSETKIEAQKNNEVKYSAIEPVGNTSSGTSMYVISGPNMSFRQRFLSVHQGENHPCSHDVSSHSKPTIASSQKSFNVDEDSFSYAGSSEKSFLDYSMNNLEHSTNSIHENSTHFCTVSSLNHEVTPQLTDRSPMTVEKREYMNKLSRTSSESVAFQLNKSVPTVQKEAGNPFTQRGFLNDKRATTSSENKEVKSTESLQYLSIVSHSSDKPTIKYHSKKPDFIEIKNSLDGTGT